MNILAWERAAFSFLHGFWGQNSVLDGLFTFLASYLVWFLVLIVLALLFRSKALHSAAHVFFTALSLLISLGLLRVILNFFIRRSDPISGSEMIAFLPLAVVVTFTLASSLIEMKQRRLGVWYLILGFFMGASQIVTGAHWPLDILIAAAVGILSVLLISLLVPLKKAGPVV